ncbi:tigger transposable element-derived protein 6-like [Neodiprion lecontei]|uniref:Tigger transposable element-derived protein 6-like n=1 Tax=Neodiprion lecontei TaxID=441921 RepID=A0A6J0BAI5_NEOLC|nr:tigger transposable element-derived protein 6-like [Neodiprion lecontei]
MFVDNCTAHNNMPKLEYVKLLYLPANTTSKLQPMDQGIINNFKVYYRKEVVQYVLKSIEDDKSPEINILQAMRFARKAWFSVSKTKISNGYKKAGFKVTNVSEPENLQEEVETIARFPEWNKLIFTCRNNENDQQPSFQDFVSMDDDVIISEDLTDDEIVSTYSSLETEAEIEEVYEETSVNISKREAMEALETLHKYFEMSNIDDQRIFDQIYAIEKQVLATSHQIQTNITDYFES